MNSRIVWFICLALIGAQGAVAGQLRIGAYTIEGDQVGVPVVLEGDVGKGVAALNFHLNFDPAVFEPLAAISGSAATAANKQVQANAVAPGDYIVIMMGLNQNTMASGEVAKIILRKVGQTESGRTNISITQTTFSSPEGVEIPSQGDQGVIQLDDRQNPDTTSGGEATSGNEVPGATARPSSRGARPVASQPNVRPDATPGNPTRQVAPAQPETASATPSRTDPPTGTPGAATPTDGAIQQLAAAVEKADAVRSALEAPSAVPGAPSTTGAAGATGTGPAPASSPALSPQPSSGTSVPGGMPSEAVATAASGAVSAPEKSTGQTAPSGGTMSLAKVATPLAGEAEKIVDMSASGVVESESKQGAGSRTVLTVVVVLVMTGLLGVVYVVRRKLFS